MELEQSLLKSLAEKGWVCSDHLLNRTDLLRLQDLAKKRLATLSFRPAQIAQGINSQIRSDSLLWLDPKSNEDKWIFDLLEKWREPLTRDLMVSAPHIEAHMTHYSQGQSYQVHCDQPHGSDSRVLTYVVYLHEEWKPGLGGELVICSGPSGQEVERIEPQPGRVVFFKSHEIWHQVKETYFDRISLTGWFRRL